MPRPVTSPLALRRDEHSLARGPSASRCRPSPVAPGAGFAREVPTDINDPQVAAVGRADVRIMFELRLVRGATTARATSRAGACASAASGTDEQRLIAGRDRRHAGGSRSLTLEHRRRASGLSARRHQPLRRPHDTLDHAAIRGIENRDGFFCDQRIGCFSWWVAGDGVNARRCGAWYDSSRRRRLSWPPLGRQLRVPRLRRTLRTRALRSFGPNFR